MQESENINDTYFFTECELTEPDIDGVTLSVYDCYQLFSKDAWEKLNKQAEDMGIGTLSISDDNTYISMNQSLYDASLHDNIDMAPKLTKQLADSVNAYSKAQGISPNQALSMFMTIGIKTVIQDKLGYGQAISKYAMDCSQEQIDATPDVIASIERDNPLDSCDTLD